MTGSLLIHVAAGHDVSTGAADVLHDHLAYMDGGVEDNAVQRGHHLGHLALGHRLGGLYRAAGMQAARTVLVMMRVGWVSSSLP